MNFTAFNNANNWLEQNNITQKTFGEATAAFLKAGDHIGHYQAYSRAHPNTLPGLATAIWVNRPVGLAGAALLAHLTGQIDNLWRNTVKSQGQIQRLQEKTLRQAYWQTGGGVDTCPELQEYAKHGLQQNVLAGLKISKIHLLDYASLLEALAQPYYAETPVNKYNQSHKQAVKLHDEAAGLAGATDSEILNYDGSYKKDAPKWEAVEACANYWIQELPAVAARRQIKDAIHNWGAGGTAEKLLRRVSAGEKDYSTTSHVVSQGPQSFERHKWFYFRTGAPSVGHAWILTLNLRGAGIDFLMNQATEVNDESQRTSPHALLRKTNEPNCIGIHEDLLETFCASMLQNITAAAA